MHCSCSCSQSAEWTAGLRLIAYLLSRKSVGMVIVYARPWYLYGQCLSVLREEEWVASGQEPSRAPNTNSSRSTGGGP